MRNRIIAIVAAIILFVAVVVIMLFMNFSGEKKEINTIDRGVASLPRVSFVCAGMDANQLLGYADYECAISAASTVMPAAKRLEIVLSDDDNIDSVTVMLESLDRSRLLDESEESLYKKGGKMRCAYDISVMAEKKEKYYLTVKVKTKDEKTAYYTTCLYVVDDDNIASKDKLISLAKDFSDNALNKKTEELNRYLSYDPKKSGSNLSYVNLSTAANLVTWAGLSPVAGEKTLMIYEWNESQITMGLNYNVSSTYEDEQNEYYVKENFVLRERDEKLFILNYERYTQQRFDGRADEMGRTSILLGIQDLDRMSTLQGNKKNSLYFVVDGSVWYYDGDRNSLTNVFGGEFESVFGDYPYTLKLLGNVDGRLQFISVGYEISGVDEGKELLSLYDYDPEANILGRRIISRLEGDYPEIVKTSGIIACVSADKLFTVGIGSNIYSVDMTGSDVICLTEDMDVSTVRVDSTGKFAAWHRNGDDKTIYLMNLEDGTLENITNESPIKLVGFVRQDVAYAISSTEEWKYYGFPMHDLYDKVCVVGSDMRERTSYVNDDGKLCDISVNENNVTMSLCKRDDDSWIITGNDALNQASGGGKDNAPSIMKAASEGKRDYYYINIPAGADKDKPYFCMKATFEASRPMELKCGGSKQLGEYETYSFGERILTTDSSQTAIAKAYDSFGIVKDSHNSVVWNRDARDLYLTMNLPKMSWTEEGHEDEMAAMSPLERGVDIFVYAGVMTGEISKEKAESEDRKTAASVCEELTGVFGDRLVVLGQCDISNLLYYINLRHPVMALSNDGNAYLLIGYTSTKITYYNPADRSSETITLEEAATRFGALDAYYIAYR